MATRVPPHELQQLLEEHARTALPKAKAKGKAASMATASTADLDESSDSSPDERPEQEVLGPDGFQETL